jgi:hypothetical protein
MLDALFEPVACMAAMAAIGYLGQWQQHLFELLVDLFRRFDQILEINVLNQLFNGVGTVFAVSACPGFERVATRENAKAWAIFCFDPTRDQNRVIAAQKFRFAETFVRQAYEVDHGGSLLEKSPDICARRS